MSNDYSPEVEHVYVSPKAPKLRTSITIDEKTYPVVFENCQVILKGEVARVFDETAMTKHAIRQYVHKVDKLAAEELVRAHMKNQGSAVKGAADTANLDRLRGQITEGSSKTLGEMAPNNPDALAAFSKTLANGDLLVTERVETPAIPEGNTAAKTGETGGSLKLSK